MKYVIPGFGESESDSWCDWNESESDRQNQFKTKPGLETLDPRTRWKWEWYLIWSKGKWKSITNKTWAWNMRSQAPVKVSLHWLHRRHTRFPLEGGGSQPSEEKLWQTSQPQDYIVIPSSETPIVYVKLPHSSLSTGTGQFKTCCRSVGDRLLCWRLLTFLLLLAPMGKSNHL